MGIVSNMKKIEVDMLRNMANAAALKHKPTESMIWQLQHKPYQKVDKAKEIFALSTVVLSGDEKKIRMGEITVNNVQNLVPGTHFMFKDYEWVVLDNDIEGGIMAIMSSAWNNATYRFSNDGSNNYTNSSLRKRLLNDLLPVLCENNLVSHKVSLIADNGDTHYGSVNDKVFILNCDEYRKYRNYIPLTYEQMWTCTPKYILDTGGYRQDVCYVDKKGILYEYSAAAANGVFPACVFNPKKLIAKRGMIYLEEKSDD